MSVRCPFIKSNDEQCKLYIKKDTNNIGCWRHIEPLKKQADKTKEVETLATYRNNVKSEVKGLHDKINKLKNIYQSQEELYEAEIQKYKDQNNNLQEKIDEINLKNEDEKNILLQEIENMRETCVAYETVKKYEYIKHIICKIYGIKFGEFNIFIFTRNPRHKDFIRSKFKCTPAGLEKLFFELQPVRHKWCHPFINKNL